MSAESDSSKSCHVINLFINNESNLSRAAVASPGGSGYRYNKYQTQGKYNTKPGNHPLDKSANRSKNNRQELQTHKSQKKNDIELAYKENKYSQDRANNFDGYTAYTDENIVRNSRHTSSIQTKYEDSNNSTASDSDTDSLSETESKATESYSSSRIEKIKRKYNLNSISQREMILSQNSLFPTLYDGYQRFPCREIFCNSRRGRKKEHLDLSGSDSNIRKVHSEMSVRGQDGSLGSRPVSCHQYLTRTDVNGSVLRQANPNHGRPTRTLLLRSIRKLNSEPPSRNSYYRPNEMMNPDFEYHFITEASKDEKEMQKLNHLNSRLSETINGMISEIVPVDETVHSYMTGGKYNRYCSLTSDEYLKILGKNCLTQHKDE